MRGQTRMRCWMRVERPALVESSVLSRMRVVRELSHRLLLRVLFNSHVQLIEDES